MIAGLHRTALRCTVVTMMLCIKTLAAQETPQAPGDSSRGERLFRRNCAQCHALTENRTGPRLGDVYGRTVASVAGFRYSAAVTSQSFTWSDATLDAWLAGPRDFIRGAAMPARLRDRSERADVIAYLRTLR